MAKYGSPDLQPRLLPAPEPSVFTGMLPDDGDGRRDSVTQRHLALSPSLDLDAVNLKGNHEIKIQNKNKNIW